LKLNSAVEISISTTSDTQSYKLLNASLPTSH